MALNEISIERRNELYTQIVLTLVNEREYYDRVRNKVFPKDWEAFRVESNNARNKFCKEATRGMLGNEARYVNLLLLHEFMNELCIQQVPPSCREYRAMLTEMLEMPKQPESIETKEETTMNANETIPAFETKHFVFGKQTSEMSSNELIQAIKRVEGEIEELKAVKTKSSHIEGRIIELQAMLVEIVATLDKIVT